MAKDKDHLPVAFSATIDHTASISDMPKTLFDVLQQTLVYLSLAIRWEQDPSSSESNSRDLPLGVPLCNAPPTSALR